MGPVYDTDMHARICVTFATFSMTAMVAFGQPVRQVRAGAFAADITPKQWPVRLIGGFEEPLAESAHDPLHARALVLDDGRAKIAIVVVDSCFLPRALDDRARSRAEKATGIPAGHMLIAASHTHTAPPAKPAGASAVELAYQELLVRQIAQAVIEPTYPKGFWSSCGTRDRTPRRGARIFNRNQQESLS